MRASSNRAIIIVASPNDKHSGQTARASGTAGEASCLVSTERRMPRRFCLWQIICCGARQLPAARGRKDEEHPWQRLPAPRSAGISAPGQSEGRGAPPAAEAPLRGPGVPPPRPGPARPGPPERPPSAPRRRLPGPGPPCRAQAPPCRPSKAGADTGGSKGEADLCPVQADPQEREIKCSLPSGCNKLYSAIFQPGRFQCDARTAPPQTLPRAAWLLPLPQAGEPGAAQPSPSSTPSAHCSPQGAGGGVPWDSRCTTATPSFAPKQSQFEQLKHSYRGFCSPRHGFVAGPLGLHLGALSHPSVLQHWA